MRKVIKPFINAGDLAIELAEGIGEVANLDDYEYSYTNEACYFHYWLFPPVSREVALPLFNLLISIFCACCQAILSFGSSL